MKKVALSILIICSLLFSCTGNSSTNSTNSTAINSSNETVPPSIVGSWKANSTVIYLFAGNGTCIKRTTTEVLHMGKWELLDDRIIITWDDAESETHTIVKLKEDVMIIKFNGLIEYTWTKIHKIEK